MGIKAEITTREIAANVSTNQIEAKIITNKIEIANLGRQGVTGLQGDKGDQGEKGDKGDTGEGAIAGGTARQVLTKIDGTDYNAEWRGNWNIYAMNVEYTGVETTIASGIVLDCTIDGATIYRFINGTNNASGYPLEDSFYSTFNDPTLSNLLATRG